MPDDAALRVENHQAGADFIGEAEQVELHAELAVVAPLGLLEQLEVAVEGLLGLPGGAVDALQAGVALIAAPVGGRAAGQLERRDVPGGGDVRTAAQVSPDPLPRARVEVVVGGQLVPADLHDIRIPGLVVDQFQLVGLIGQLRAGLVLGFVDPPGEQLPLLDDGAHPLFQRLEVLGGEGLRDLEVVVKPVGDGRADAQPGTGESLLHGLGQNVGGGVPNDASPLLGVGADRRDLDVLVRNPAQIPQRSAGVANHHDRAGLTPTGQARVAHRRTRTGAGCNPK